MRTIVRIVGVSIALHAAMAASAQVTPTFANVRYGDGHPRQALDVYVPPGPPAVRPAIVWVHGGGWQTGDKSSAAIRANALMQLGFVVVGVNYRLSQHALFPAQIHDCKAAIRHLRANAATYGIDPARIGAWGPSAGGHLVALLGSSAGVPEAEGTVGGNPNQSSRVQAVADYFGPTDFFTVEGWHTVCDPPHAEALMLGACLADIQANVDNPEWAEIVGLARLAGPVTHVSADDPPFYIAHGTKDGTVWLEHSEILHTMLVGAGVPSTLRRVDGAGHGLPLTEDVQVRLFFVNRLITNPPPVPCPGDANRDGTVNAADLSVLLGGFGRPAPSGENGDFNGDALIDGADLSVLLSNFGTGC